MKSFSCWLYPHVFEVLHECVMKVHVRCIFVGWISQIIFCEFGSTPDEAKVHFDMVNASRCPKELIKDYCFRMSALGSRYNLSEAAIVRYTKGGLKHRELQTSIAATSFATMKQLRTAVDSYLRDRSRQRPFGSKTFGSESKNGE